MMTELEGSAGEASFNEQAARAMQSANACWGVRGNVSVQSSAQSSSSSSSLPQKRQYMAHGGGEHLRSIRDAQFGESRDHLNPHLAFKRLRSENNLNILTDVGGDAGTRIHGRSKSPSE